MSSDEVGSSANSLSTWVVPGRVPWLRVEDRGAYYPDRVPLRALAPAKSTALLNLCATLALTHSYRTADPWEAEHCSCRSQANACRRWGASVLRIGSSILDRV
jgi:hypothetical protein